MNLTVKKIKTEVTFEYENKLFKYSKKPVDEKTYSVSVIRIATGKDLLGSKSTLTDRTLAIKMIAGLQNRLVIPK